MGNLNQAFKCIVTTLFFLFLMISYTASSHSSNQEIQPQPQNPSSTIPAHYHQHQVFYLKNTDPHMFLSRQERAKMRRINRNKNMKKHRKNKKMVKNLQSRPFSVMLPKGFVPPSGSSPCHNAQPNSVSFHCHLTTTTTTEP